MPKYFLIACLVARVFVGAQAKAQTTQPFDGSAWNLSTGNLSTYFIQASPIGAHPRPSVLEPPPAPEALKQLKAQGLVAYEDYIAWGAVEREPGKWDWTQHDAIEHAIHEAGLKYVVYNWVHFPPTWLRDEATLMKCLEHDKTTNYLSIFDPKTIEHYDHFYRNLKDHFGDRVDGVYACILGPYGEGNYPLNVPDWVNIGHCHEGYWCADDFARKAFGKPMPAIDETFRAFPDRFVSAKDRRAWIDFITWYHQALIDFTEKSIQTTLKYFPKEKVRTKPGGNAGGVNPIAWGTYCPGYAKMAARYGIVLQPADWHGAYFGDKWVATAYHFYGVTLGTEPAGGLDHNGFVKRLFSDISCGTKQLFTYEFAQHVDDIHKYAHLINGKAGDVQLAVLCPTTLYRLGGDLSPTIKHADELRDVVDFDVLDELLIADGALTVEKYKALLIFQGDFIDQPILDKLDKYANAGGVILVAGKDPIRNVEGEAWEPAANLRYTAANMVGVLRKLAPDLHVTLDRADGVWTTRRGAKVIHFNGRSKPAKIGDVEIPPHEIWSNE
jgi:hypothetical protein